MGSGASEPDGGLFPFGPFHRLESSTQSARDAIRQAATGELWGRAPRGSAWPQVQAYRGPLPGSTGGIEFWTQLPPNLTRHPYEVRWGGPARPDVEIRGDYAIIKIRVTKTRPPGGGEPAL